MSRFGYLEDVGGAAASTSGSLPVRAVVLQASNFVQSPTPSNHFAHPVQSSGISSIPGLILGFLYYTKGALCMF